MWCSHATFFSSCIAKICTWIIFCHTFTIVVLLCNILPFVILYGYSVGPKYEFVLIDKGIVERVAVTFSGYRQ